MKRILMALILVALTVMPTAMPTAADGAYQPLPFTQNWSNTGLITADDDWSGVPGIIGYRGDDPSTTAAPVDPRTVLADTTSSPVDVNANRTDPNTFTTGGVAEFELADPVVALQGSGTADAPFLLIHVNTTGWKDIVVSYKLRDIDGSADNAVQPVALQYRVGTSGPFTNVPAAFVADATTGPNEATAVTNVSVTLPADADNQAQLQIRIITGNAVGSDEWVGVDDISITGTPSGPADSAPSVSSKSPDNAAANVPLNANIVVGFSEPVDLDTGWYTIACTLSGNHSAVVSGGPQSFTLNPDVNFAFNETCTVTIFAAQVHDQDADDPPDTLTADVSWSFTTLTGICPGTPTPIGQVQGSGASTPLLGTSVTVRGMVVGDFQGAGALNGFYVQDAGDGDPATSDGIFVYGPGSTDVSVGDTVQVTGVATEFNGLTELTGPTITFCSTPIVVTPTPVTLPEVVNGDLERYEGMLVTFPQTLTAGQNYFLGRYGQITLSADGRMYNPTNGNGLGDTVDLNARRILFLDDGRTLQNPNPIPYIGADNTHRAGDTLTGLTGVLDYGPINASSPPAYDYRVHPTAPVDFVRANPRTAAPDPVGGGITVAAMNTLNYFTTIDPRTGPSGYICGPARNMECRGADSAAELQRQRDKLVAALSAINADVLGLIELENTDDAATADLTAGLNAVLGAGTYAYVVPPAPGTDAIRVGLLYKPGIVTPVGPALNYQTGHPTYGAALFDRPPLAQTFSVNATGEVFSVVVNHFKSKSSCPVTPGDPDLDYGQGCWNAKRNAQATALMNFIAVLQATDPDVLVVGDLNSYGAEDPINTLIAAGLVDELSAHVPAASRYTYIFDGQAGNLDHALATPTLHKQVAGATIWHINADEPSVIDYNLEFKPQDLYTPTPYRSSDHDPIIVGLNLAPPADLVVHGWVFIDANGNGWRERDETAGLASVGLTLTQNGAVVRTGRTVGPDGWFNLDALTNGQYCLQAAIPPTHVPTSPTEVCFTLSGRNQVVTFGVQPGRAAIGDLVWYDSDGDGMQDAGEPGIGGVTLALRANEGGKAGAVIATATTDATGAYLFAPVVPGSYFVDVTDEAGLLTGLSLSTGADPLGPITVAHGDDYRAADFGYFFNCGPAYGVIGGLTWRDDNGNGAVDAGEPGLVGVSVCAQPLSYMPRYCALTNGAGFYRLCVPRHTYLVAPVDAPAGLQLGQNRFSLPLVVLPGQRYEQVNFDFVIAQP